VAQAVALSSNPSRKKKKKKNGDVDMGSIPSIAKNKTGHVYI
jgi:hypothetical protein